jgi:hypothetical protein
MATPSPSRLLVELAAHSVQLLAVDAAGQILGYVECTPDAASVTAALAQIGANVGPAQVQALLHPSPSFVVRASGEESASIRTVKSLWARAESAAQTGADDFKAVAFDGTTGNRVDTVGSSPWVIAGAASEQLDAAKARLESLGLAAAEVNLGLPARLGAVALTLQDLPESTRVLVWQIGETDAVVSCVSAVGCEAVATIPVGFPQLFDAVQAGLGLRFRAAATKLFFNASYDFTDAAGPIAERLAALLRPAITALGVTPTTLHVAGLPTGQMWLARALSSALELDLLTPDLPAFCAQRRLSGPGAESNLSVAALGLLLQASHRDGAEAPWLPSWLDTSAAVVVTAPAPAPAAPAPVAAVSTPVKVDPAASEPVLAAAAKPVPVPAGAGGGPKSAVAAKPAIVGATKPAVPVASVKPAVAAKLAKPVAEVPAVVLPAVEDEPLVVEDVGVEAAAVVPKKKPVALLAAVAAVVVLGGLGAVMFSGGGAAKAGAVAEVTKVSPEELQRREQENARLEAEELASPRSFRNTNYSFEVSDRGYLRKLTDKNKRVLVDEFGWIELQGSFAGTGKPFTAGTMSDSDFTPSVTKAVREGTVVFEIKGTHARFNLTTLVTCLPKSLRVETVFTPIQMTEYRGPLALVYSVKMNRSALALGQRGVVTPGAVSFETQSGAVGMKFDPAIWGPVGEAGKQTVTVGGNLVLFNFAGGAEPQNNVLNAELVLP